MNSPKKRACAWLLSATMASLAAGCATPSQPSIVIGRKPEPTPLSQSIQEIDAAPSTDFLTRQADYSLDLQTFSRKLGASSRAATAK